MEFNKVELGKTNRSSLEYREAGGKGINVSIVLNNLMIPSRALGAVGGFTQGIFFIQPASKYEYIEPVFTFIEGHTRINGRLRRPVGNRAERQGPILRKSYADDVKTGRTPQPQRYFVLSGNCPDNLVDLTEK